MATGYDPDRYAHLTRWERRIWAEEHRRMNSKD